MGYLHPFTQYLSVLVRDFRGSSEQALALMERPAGDEDQDHKQTVRVVMSDRRKRRLSAVSGRDCGGGEVAASDAVTRGLRR